MFTCLVQHCWTTGELPERLTWSSLVIIPKSGGGYRGIGLLEVIWKVISKIIYTRVKQRVVFHLILHGFWAQRGTGTCVLEAKLFQQLANIKQQALHVIFLDFHKAYDTVDRE